MFSKPDDRHPREVTTRWAMTTALTVYYTISFIALLAVSCASIYWRVAHGMRQQEQDYLGQKLELLTRVLQRQPLDRTGLEQEVRDEAELSGRSRSPFFLRILDPQDHFVIETDDMASNLPVGVFPLADAGTRRESKWRSADSCCFLLASAAGPATTDGSPRWQVQAALNITPEEDLLAGYRRDIAIVLATGLLFSALIGSWITRRGLQPIAAITRATERVGAQHLQERIQVRPWPKELTALAGAFDQMLDRLQEAFERLSQFSADLAHELRTPINNLMGEAQVTLTRGRSEAQYAQVLQSALEELGRLSRMIDNMLFLAQADQARAAIAPKALDARTELQAVADFYQPLADEQGVTLNCEGHAQITADPQLLRRALSNLLSNAVKFTPRGGRITLRARNDTDHGYILSVIDSGPGIPAEHLPKLGNRFYRVDPSRTDSASSSGLGLAIVKSIMALHRGILLIESTVGSGTTASLLFSAE
jgi:two-component system heavy metal sensor histidine kinase CusS